MKIKIHQRYSKAATAEKAQVEAAVSKQRWYLLTGGGTGGHVIPLIAVAIELRRRGHPVVFVGTREGIESRLVPRENFPLEHVSIGGLKRVGWQQTLRTILLMPLALVRALYVVWRYWPAAVFSVGGYVAGPATVASWMMRRPVVLMEPNAMPGMANRWMAHMARRALLSFDEAKKWFRASRVEMTGLPVRAEFFLLPRKQRGEDLIVLVTGGSRGSRKLNETGKASWTLFQRRGLAVHWIHQCGIEDENAMTQAFAESGAQGRVVAFLDDMPTAFATADLVICRSGAGTVSELAAAGKPSILVPFPYSADDHQLRNAEALARAGAARLILDKELTAEELYLAIQELALKPGALETMGEAARRFAKPDAARRAAEILEQEAAGGRKNG